MYYKMGRMKNLKKSYFIVTTASLSILLLIVACSTFTPKKSRFTPAEVMDNTPIISTLIPTLDFSPTSSLAITTQPTLLPIEIGTLIFSDHEGVYKLDLLTKELLILDHDSGQVHSEIYVFDHYIYYFRTMPNDVPGTAGFGPSQIFMTDMDGSEPVRLTFSDNPEFNLSISNDGRYLAYVRDNNLVHDPNRYELRLYDLEKRSIETILNNSENQYCCNSWSPDGRKLTFFEIGETLKGGKLFLYDVEEKTLLSILPDELIPETKVAWSPDGKQIALSIHDRQTFNIAFYDIGNEKIHSVLNTTQSVENLIWSNDSQKVIYEITICESNDDTNPDALFMYDIQTGTNISIEDDNINQGRFSYNARWSPDGKFVEYNVLLENDVAEIRLYSPEENKWYRIELPKKKSYMPESWFLFNVN